MECPVVYAGRPDWFISMQILWNGVFCKMCTTHSSKKFRIIKLIVLFHSMKKYSFPELIVFRSRWSLGIVWVSLKNSYVYFSLLRGKVFGNTIKHAYSVWKTQNIKTSYCGFVWSSPVIPSHCYVCFYFLSYILEHEVKMT